MNTFELKINANVLWNVARTPNGGFVAVCDPLGLALEGDDEAELREVINESLQFFFLDHFEDGTLSAFLSKQGWSLMGDLPPVKTEGDLVRFQVPWRLEPSHAA